MAHHILGSIHPAPPSASTRSPRPATARRWHVSACSWPRPCPPAARRAAAPFRAARKVALAEKTLQRAPRDIRAGCFSLGKAGAQFDGGQVDQLNIIGQIQHRVGDSFRHPHACDARHRVVQAFQMCTFTVVQTSIPASRISCTSCQRLAWRRPGALVWASSSTSSSLGRRFRAASRSNSSST